MKGLFNWFKSNTKIKRWLFLILIGIVFLCIAISNLIIEKEREFYDLIFIAISFIIGFLFAVIGIIHIQKRTLEILVENTNLNNGGNVKSLIYNKKVYNQGPKIVVIGGKEGELPTEKMMPCGYCRQFMSEFVDKDFKVIVVNNDDSTEEFTIDELLPNSFEF